MRKIIINNTEYRLERRVNEGKKLINVRREEALNPYVYDSTYRLIPMSWRRYKKMILKKIKKHQLIRI